MQYRDRIVFSWLGFAAGATAATLLVPRSGTEMRHYCQSKGRETANLLMRRTAEFRNRAIQTMEHGKQMFQDQLKHYSAAVNAGKRALGESPLIRV